MNINGIQAGHCIITPTCRENRGPSGAFEEAVRRLRNEYNAILLARSDIDECDFHLALVLETPRHKKNPLPAHCAGSSGEHDAQT